MRVSKDVFFVESTNPFYGLRSDLPSTQIPPNFSPQLLNMTIREGIIFKRSGYYRIIDSDVFITAPSEPTGWEYQIDLPTAPDIDDEVILTNPTIADINAAIAPNTKISIVGTVSGVTTALVVDEDDVWLDFTDATPTVGGFNVTWSGGPTTNQFFFHIDSVSVRVTGFKFSGNGGQIGCFKLDDGVRTDIWIEDCWTDECYHNQVLDGVRVLFDRVRFTNAMAQTTPATGYALYFGNGSNTIEHITVRDSFLSTGVGEDAYPCRGTPNLFKLIDSELHQQSTNRSMWIYDGDFIQLTRTLFRGRRTHLGAANAQSGFGDLPVKHVRVDGCIWEDSVAIGPNEPCLEFICAGVNEDIKIRDCQWNNCDQDWMIGVTWKDTAGGDETRDINWWPESMLVDGLPFDTVTHVFVDPAWVDPTLVNIQEVLGGFKLSFSIGGSLEGEILALVDFQLLNETRHLVALTSRRQYRFDDGLDAWVDITPVGTTHAITDVDTGAGTFTIGGDHTAVYTAGTDVRVQGSTGNDGEYVVISSIFSGGNTIISVGSIADPTADGTIAVILELTTIEGDYIDWTIGTDLNTHRLYMTNGRDRPRYWDGVTATFTLWNPTYTSFVTCKTLEVFFSHLVLGNVTTTVGEPKLVAWSDTGDFDEFEDGNAGAALIPGIQGSILQLENLGDRLIVYSNDTIASTLFVGFPIVFSFEILIQDTRLASPRAICNLGGAHLVVSQENIYIFDGTKAWRPVGDRIRDAFKKSINYEFGQRLFTFNDVAKRHIYIVTPLSETSSVAFVLDYNVFNLNEFKWMKIEYADRPSCMGFYLRRDGATWFDPPDVAWEEDYALWADEGEQVRFPIRLMGSGQEVFAMDDGSGLDGGVQVEGSYETRDFVIPEIDITHNARWLEMEVDLSGLFVTIEYSLDQGTHWTPVTTPEEEFEDAGRSSEGGSSSVGSGFGSDAGVETEATGEVTLFSEFQHFAFPIDGVSRTIRFRFASTSYFALRWLRIAAVKAGAR